ncbi:MAG: hypothetical protein KBA31_12790 [Alphaproteobacteria bacterium]|nr:hypothetical protein [Alphaproteobacteria bacterium]
MAISSAHITTAIGTITRAVVGTAFAWSAISAHERQRPVDEILDVQKTFVAGYPIRVDTDGRRIE